MDIIERINELKIKDTLKEVLITGVFFSKNKNVQEIQKVKTQLREKCGIVFVNVIAQTSTNASIMIKTNNLKYIYDYNKLTEELTIKGERKNVNTK